MARKYPGMYIFYDWYTLLEDIPARDFKKMLLALMKYAENGTEMPAFGGRTERICVFFRERIKLSKINAENGQKGGNETKKAYRVSRIEAVPPVGEPALGQSGGITDGITKGVADGAALGAAADSPAAVSTADDSPNPIEPHRTFPYPTEPNPTYGEGSIPPGAPAGVSAHLPAGVPLGNSSGDVPPSAAESLPPPPPAEREQEVCREREVRRGYGIEGNVMLTPAEYRELRAQGIPEAYVDRYSEQVKARGYTPKRDYDLLLRWWAQDRDKPEWSGRSDRSAPPSTLGGGTGSFDTDDFWNAAVRHSLGEEA